MQTAIYSGESLSKVETHSLRKVLLQNWICCLAWLDDDLIAVTEPYWRPDWSCSGIWGQNV